MRHHNDSERHDALNDYLDSLAGVPPAASRAEELDPDLRDGVDRFFELAEQAGMAPRARHQPGKPAMNATLPASTTLPAPKRKTRRNAMLPAWTQHLYLVSTGLLIAAVIALSFAAFGPNGIGNDGNGSTGDGPSVNGAVPIATVPEDTQTSSIPRPTADECTVEVAREELITDIQEANIVTEPEQQRYEQAVEPSEEDTQGIMQAFRKWQACWNLGFSYQVQLQTPWYNANHVPIFRTPDGGNLRPVSDEKVEAYVDVLLDDGDADTTERAGGTPSPTIGTPAPWQAPNGLPIPENATPVTSNFNGRAYPTILAEEIVITGPDTASAQAYFVNPETREVIPATPDYVEFVKIDGQWLINDYRAGSRG